MTKKNPAPEQIERLELRNKHIKELVIDHCSIDRVKIKYVHVNDAVAYCNFVGHMRFMENLVETLYRSRNVINGKPDKLEFP